MGGGVGTRQQRGVLGQLRRAITPEVNAISTGLLGLTLILLTAFFLLNRRRG